MAKPNWVIYSSAPSPQHPNLYTTIQRANHYTRDNVHLPVSKMKFSSKHMWPSSGKLFTFVGSRRSFLVCQSTDTRNTETKEHLGHYGDCSNILRSQKGNEHPETAENISFSLGLAEACKYFSNGAKFVNERAKNQIVLLSRGIMTLDSRARKDVAFLGSEFLKIDARAREDTEKVNRYVKIKAERLHHVATILKNIAQSRLKSAADMHWSDGALEVDLKRAAKHRAMEDCLMALENLQIRIHLYGEKDYINTNEVPKHITLEKNGKTLGFFPGEVSTDHISAIQECYQSIASALSEADGIDYTDPEELELLVAALIDLDAMDGKSSVSLLAECSSSPDVSTRRALANALSAAPSLWTLGNAGMGALQRLAEDCDPAIAAAAAKTIYKLKKQWEIEEVHSWRFIMNQPSSIMSEDKAEDTGGTD